MEKTYQKSLKICLLSFAFLPQLVRAASASLDNPLAAVTVQALIQDIVTVVQIISTPIIVFFILYSGFLFVTARGNTETLDTAKKALMYAIIGGVVIIGASAIGVIVANTANQF